SLMASTLAETHGQRVNGQHQPKTRQAAGSPAAWVRNGLLAARSIGNEIPARIEVAAAAAIAVRAAVGRCIARGAVIARAAVVVSRAAVIIIRIAAGLSGGNRADGPDDAGKCRSRCGTAAMAAMTISALRAEVPYTTGGHGGRHTLGRRSREGRASRRQSYCRNRRKNDAPAG